MNFLALTQKLVEKCGMSGNGPVSVAGQTGEMKRAVNWINEAWLNIQEMREDWDWMRGSVSFQTVPQKAAYTAQEAGISDLAEWLMNTSICSFRTYDTNVGVASEIFLNFINYNNYRDTYLYGNMRLSYARPLYVTVTPDMSIALGQIPDSANYTIVGDYFKTPSQMTLDADIPALPSRFHMLIVYQAMIYYGEYEQDDYVRQTAKENFNAMLSRMTVAQLPEMVAGGALA
jgi:hypothetical protein